MDLIYRCPVCQLGMEQIEKSLHCQLNHTFDISKECYVNLLLVNQKNSANPGDSAMMAESRRLFLDKGYYDQLVEEISAILGKFLLNYQGDHLNILDLGCGVGFYSGKLNQYIKNLSLPSPIQLWGLDISKAAIQKASKKYNEVKFAIGSSFNLPYLDKSVDFVFSVFAPFDHNELARILKPGGQVLIVRPGVGHLQELAEIIYGKSELQGQAASFALENKMELVEVKEISFPMQINRNEDLLNLLKMTPYFWHLNEENEAILDKLNNLKITASFNLTIYQKMS